jgi:hypothetical protein
MSWRQLVVRWPVLQTDRPHVFKIEGTYDLAWGTGIGLYWLAGSGTPLQTQMSEKGIPFFLFGRGDMGRTPAYTRTDLFLQHGSACGARSASASGSTSKTCSIR